MYVFRFGDEDSTGILFESASKGFRRVKGLPGFINFGFNLIPRLQLLRAHAFA